MAPRGIKRARKGSEDTADADPLDPLPAISHVQEIIGVFCELRREATSDKFIGSWGFTELLSKALSGLLEGFRGADRLGRPYVTWELLEAVDKALCRDRGISVLATTSVRKPTFFEEPISDQAFDSLDKIMGNGNMESLFHRILEWCETGRVTPAEPTLAELAASPELPPAELSRLFTDNTPERELSFPPRISRENTGYTPERELFSVPRAARVPTGYTPEREFSFAPRRQAITAFANPAGAQSKASALDRAAPPQPEPGTHRAKKIRMALEQRAPPVICVVPTSRTASTNRPLSSPHSRATHPPQHVVPHDAQCIRNAEPGDPNPRRIRAPRRGGGARK